MQQVEENKDTNIGSSVAYLHLPLWSSSTINSLDDYCRLFESRSHLWVYRFNELILFYYINFRLIKEAYTRMSESSLSSPYDIFITNSIQLVHMAKVGDRFSNRRQ